MALNSRGHVSSGFESVADTFEEIISADPKMGGALSIRLGGDTVVDLWGGVADARSDSPWGERTLNVIFSATKGLSSLLAAQLVQNGKLDYQALVTEYWPEFGGAGKGSTKVKDLLSHRAGLAILKEDLTTEDVLNWKEIVRRLEIEEPLWIPGENHAYHAITHGWLIGEVIRRIVGESIGHYFRSTVAQRLKADTWIGLPSSEESRVAHLHATKEWESLFTDLESDPTPEGDFFIRGLTLGKAFPPTLATSEGGFNERRVHAAEIPGAGGISTARGLATIWSATVVRTDGVRLLEDEVIEEATQVQSEGRPFLGQEPPYSRFGMGFQLSSPAREYLGLSSFGHDGAGGQCAFADSKHRVGFAFLTNQMDGPMDERATRLVEALRRLL